MIGTCLCLHTLSDWFAQSAFILKVFQSTWKYLFQKYLFCIFQQGDFDKASSILHIALRMAQDMNHLDGVTYIYNLLADMAFERVSSLNVWWQYGTICFMWSCHVTLKPIFLLFSGRLHAGREVIQICDTKTGVERYWDSFIFMVDF